MVAETEKNVIKRIVVNNKVDIDEIDYQLGKLECTTDETSIIKIMVECIKMDLKKAGIIFNKRDKGIIESIDSHLDYTIKNLRLFEDLVKVNHNKLKENIERQKVL